MKTKTAVNNTIWDSYYRMYQKESDMPGVRYPNEHLTRFMAGLAKEDRGKNKKVLELGFGTIANMLMMERNDYSVLGLEVSSDAVTRAREAIKKRQLEKRLSVDVFGGTPFPLESGSVDIVVGLQCVYYNIDQELFVKECNRVLKPGGRIFLSFFSPWHGYMEHIDGEPGSVVRFKADHPNPRLKGLELFLYRSREQFNDVYGKYFDCVTGLDEFDLYPVFMSWYYLIGQKRPYKGSLEGYISKKPEGKEIVARGAIKTCPKEMWENNKVLFNRIYKSVYSGASFPGNRYPNEYLVRFLATRERGEKKTFYADIIGKEDRIRPHGKKVLEILPLNAANLLMVSDMGHHAWGLTFSDLVKDRIGQAAIAARREEAVHVDIFKDNHFPYADGSFDYIVSEKGGSYMPDQKLFIEEMARVTVEGGEIFIGYLSPQHGYMQWTEDLGDGYWRVTAGHPDPALRGMIIYVAGKDRLQDLWSGSFDVQIKTIEFDLHRYFSSFYFVKAKKR